MNILVTGANGQLGSALRANAAQSPHSYIFTDINEMPGAQTVYLDVTDQDAVRAAVKEYQADVIVNCAGYTDVDKAEDDQQSCHMLNAVVPGYLARAIKEVGGLLVHISTDYVFGGEPHNTPCQEDQKGTPTGVYGQTKLDGEQAVIESGCEHVIIRTAWMHSRYGKNFVKTILNLTSARTELNVIFDQTGTPTYAPDLADAIAIILEDYAAAPESDDYAKTGIYHYSNEGACSWFDFAKMIAAYAGNTQCDIRPCHSDEFPSKVKRPAYSVLDKTKIKETFCLSIPYWTDSLKKCISQILNQA